MHSIASLSPGPRYRIQLSGQWHHYSYFTISKKKHFFLLQKSRFFSGIQDFSQSTAYMDFHSEKKKEWQISNYRANCDVEVDFLECGGENTSKYANFVFGPDTPVRPFWTPFLWLEKVPILHSSRLEKAHKRSKIGFWPSSAFYRFSFARTSV